MYKLNVRTVLGCIDLDTVLTEVCQSTLEKPLRGEGALCIVRYMQIGRGVSVLMTSEMFIK